MAGSPELQQAFCDKEPAASIIELQATRGSRTYFLLKRFSDIVVALFLLVLFLPIIPVVAILIRLDSPARFCSSRDGSARTARFFNFYKFRSMVTGAENGIGALRP